MPEPHRLRQGVAHVAIQSILNLIPTRAWRTAKNTESTFGLVELEAKTLDEPRFLVTGWLRVTRWPTVVPYRADQARIYESVTDCHDWHDYPGSICTCGNAYRTAVIEQLTIPRF